jgi:hypothetical protein
VTVTAPLFQVLARSPVCREDQAAVRVIREVQALLVEELPHRVGPKLQIEGVAVPSRDTLEHGTSSTAARSIALCTSSRAATFVERPQSG